MLLAPVLAINDRLLSHMGMVAIMGMLAINDRLLSHMGMLAISDRHSVFNCDIVGISDYQLREEMA